MPRECRSPVPLEWRDDHVPRRGRRGTGGPRVLAFTAAWHALAGWHFTLYPARTIARATVERPVSVVGVELFRFLGGLNAALVVLAGGACFAAPEARSLAAGALCVANASQLVQDVRIHRLGLASGAFFLQICVGDAVFTVANAAVWLAGR